MSHHAGRALFPLAYRVDKWNLAESLYKFRDRLLALLYYEVCMSGKVKGKRKGSQTPRKKANTTGKHVYLRMCAKYQANRIDRQKKTPSY